MKLPIYLTILQIISAITTSTGSSELISKKARDYVNLISAINKISRASSISVIYFVQNGDSPQMELIFNLQLMLSRARIMSSAINLEKLYDNGQWRAFVETKRDDRIMRVFLLKSEKDATEMREKANIIKRSGIYNLLLFVENGETPSVEFCMKPRGNPLHLGKGISLLVKCYEDTAIREWHALGVDEMEIHERATWEPATGLTKKTEKLILRGYAKLNGKVLYTKPKTDQGSLFRDYFDELFVTLSRVGNFTMKNIPSNSSKKEESDLYNDLYVFSSEIMPFFDLSETLFDYETAFFIKQPERKVVVSWTAYLQPFSIKLWIALVLSFITTQAIRVFIKSKIQTDSQSEKSILDDFLYICGIYCLQSLPEFPKSASLRIFYFSILFFSFYIVSIYSASFVSELAVIDTNLPFKTLQEFSQVKTHKLVVLSNSHFYTEILNAKKSPWKEMSKLLVKKTKLPKTFEEAMDMVCEEGVAFLNDVPYISTQHSSHCKLIKIEIGSSTVFAFGFPKAGSYTVSINRILKRLRTNGILNRMESEMIRKSKNVFDDADEKPGGDYPAVTFWTIFVLLTLLFGGVILSIIILISENLIFWYQKPKKVKTPKLSRRMRKRLNEKLRSKRKLLRIKFNKEELNSHPQIFPYLD